MMRLFCVNYYLCSVEYFVCIAYGIMEYGNCLVQKEITFSKVSVNLFIRFVVGIRSAHDQHIQHTNMHVLFIQKRSFHPWMSKICGNWCYVNDTWKLNTPNEKKKRIIQIHSSEMRDEQSDMGSLRKQS